MWSNQRWYRVLAAAIVLMVPGGAWLVAEDPVCNRKVGIGNEYCDNGWAESMYCVNKEPCGGDGAELVGLVGQSGLQVENECSLTDYDPGDHCVIMTLNCLPKYNCVPGGSGGCAIGNPVTVNGEQQYYTSQQAASPSCTPPGT